MLRTLTLLTLSVLCACATVANPGLSNPQLAVAQAPNSYTVRLVTTEGAVLIDVERAWAPHGADRFYNLVKAGYFDGNYFFRTVAGFMTQVGLNGDPEITAAWQDAAIPDDPRVQSNTEGMVTFAMAGPDTRTTQFFINLKDNVFLDGQGFSPFGKVRNMKPVKKLWVGYGESRSGGGLGPEQPLVMERGNAYLEEEFPDLDKIERATVIRER
jgi:peptidyl-prolyl cis-trans isomerase A (cyclophilin A)